MIHRRLGGGGMQQQQQQQQQADGVQWAAKKKFKPNSYFSDEEDLSD